MLVTHEKEKLIEAISFFVKNTRYCGTLKLFKLLYWLDYHHFRETGRLVTGLEYFALPLGPVPTELYEQFKAKSGNVVNHFQVTDYKRLDNDEAVRTIDEDDSTLNEPREREYVPSQIKPKSPFKHRFFTKRELRIAQHLAEVFRDAKADQISDISHVRGGPWHAALKKGGPNSRIDFLNALVPMMDGNYLSEDELRHRIEDLEETKRDLA